jgi:hypothetical protein
VEQSKLLALPGCRRAQTTSRRAPAPPPQDTVVVVVVVVHRGERHESSQIAS